jgi:hypothetical protein
MFRLCEDVRTTSSIPVVRRRALRFAKSIPSGAFALAAALVFSGCESAESPTNPGGRRRNLNLCISLDKATATVNEPVTVSSCGDEVPPVGSPEIDWSDGSPKTAGQTGSHQYAAAGTYTIQLYVLGAPAADRVEDDSLVKRTISIQ